VKLVGSLTFDKLTVRIHQMEVEEIYHLWTQSIGDWQHWLGVDIGWGVGEANNAGGRKDGASQHEGREGKREQLGLF